MASLRSVWGVDKLGQKGKGIALAKFSFRVVTCKWQLNKWGSLGWSGSKWCQNGKTVENQHILGKQLHELGWDEVGGSEDK